MTPSVTAAIKPLPQDSSETARRCH